MRLFDVGDDLLIEQLLQSGEKMKSIANKWDVTVAQLEGFCKRNAIEYPKKPKNHKLAQAMRRKSEAGEHKSPTILKILAMRADHEPEQIAVAVRRSVAFVLRMIDVHTQEDKQARHRATVSNITDMSKRHGVPLLAACEMLGLKYSAYCYAARKIGLHGHKKAANK
jgi:hypothetical protein